MNLYFRFLLLSLIVVGSSCNKETHSHKKPSITFRYTVFYNENTDSTSVTASFFEKESEKEILAPKENEQSGLREISSNCRALIPILLEPGSSIHFNNSQLQADEHHMYRASFKGLVSEVTFIHKKASGGVFSNKISAPVKIGFPALTTFNKNFELSFKWTGEAMSKFDCGSFSIIDSKNNKQSVSLGTSDKGTVFMPVNQTYADGIARFELSRSSRTPIEQTEQSYGEIETAYTAKLLKINIISNPSQSDPPVVSIGKNPF